MKTFAVVFRLPKRGIIFVLAKDEDDANNQAYGLVPKGTPSFKAIKCDDALRDYHNRLQKPEIIVDTSGLLTAKQAFERLSEMAGEASTAEQSSGYIPPVK